MTTAPTVAIVSCNTIQEAKGDMAAIVTIDSVRNVRLALGGRIIVSGRDNRGVDTEIVFNSTDAANFAPQALCCAAIIASPGPHPLPNTIIPGCDLPVMGWRVG